MRKLRYTFVLVGLAIGLGGSTARADMVTLRTSDSQFDTGVDNQGWWSPTFTNTDDNPIYAVGNAFGEHDLRNFFTFETSAVPSGHTVVSAILNLTRASDWGDNEDTETLEFFDVTTDAGLLNNNVGTSQSIFDDLGSGTSYGWTDVDGSGPPNDVLPFTLNASALFDINAVTNGFFSIGGVLTSQEDYDLLFLGSGDFTATLDIVTEPVPAPGAALLGIMGLSLVGGLKRRVA